MARRSKPRLSDHPKGSVSFSTEEVCLHELEAAVSVYARHYNFIAGHLLASAAHDVMRGYGKREGKPLRADHVAVIGSLYDDERKAVVDALMLGYNSIKHSNGSEVAVTIHPDFASITISQACQEFGWMFGYLTPVMAMYVMWAFVAHPPLRSVAPEAASKLFPSALLDVELSEKLGELKRILAGIDERPEEYERAREALRMKEK